MLAGLWPRSAVSLDRFDDRGVELIADFVRHLAERAHVGALRHRHRRYLHACGEGLLAADQECERPRLVRHDLVRRDGAAVFVNRCCSSLEIIRRSLHIFFNGSRAKCLPRYHVASLSRLEKV